MNAIKRTAALLLVLLLCMNLLPSAFASETEETEQTRQAQTQPDYDVNFREVNETVFAVANVNIRKGPGTHYTILGQLSYGNSVTRIGVGDNGWSMVLWKDEVVYIFSLYLSTSRPEGYHSRIDDTELMYQIAMANGLSRADYTKETWTRMIEALEFAHEALSGSSQVAADEAAQKLEEAIANLVSMNYSSLESALAELEQLAQTDENTQLWYNLARTAHEARDLLTSGNQAAVDAAAEQIRALIVQVRETISHMEAPDVVVQEVPVEVPPTDDYCNIPQHRVWPVLFFISLVLNVALVALIVIYIRNKKKNQQDDTPLVDYDIFDDTF